MSVRTAPPRSASDDTEALDLRTEDEKTVLIDAPEERTQVQPVTPPPPSSAEDRERRRLEREKALGTRRKAIDEDEAAPAVRPRRTTDKFLGSVGLLLLRLVTAAVIGIHGYAKAMDLPKVQEMLTNTIIPEPVVMSYVLAAAEIAIALGLLFGLMTRLAGLGLAAIGIGALVYVKWISNPFQGNALTGETELLLGGIGLLLACLGAGGASVDAAFRRRREAANS